MVARGKTCVATEGGARKTNARSSTPGPGSFPSERGRLLLLHASGFGGEPFAVIADPNADAVRTELHDLGSVATFDDVAAGALRHIGELRPLRKRQHAVEVFANGHERLVPLTESEPRHVGLDDFCNLLHAAPPFR